MAASNKFGIGLGERKIKLIVEKILDIITLNISDKDLLNKVIEIDGFSDKTGNQFVSNLSSFKEFK